VEVDMVGCHRVGQLLAKEPISCHAASHAQSPQSRPAERQDRFANQAIHHGLLETGSHVGHLLRREAERGKIARPSSGDGVTHGRFQAAETEIQV
jgi:hypothetical protein